MGVSSSLSSIDTTILALPAFGVMALPLRSAKHYDSVMASLQIPEECYFSSSAIFSAIF